MSGEQPPDALDKERELLVQVTQELVDVMRKHDVGGAVLLISREMAVSRLEFPAWSGVNVTIDGQKPYETTRAPLPVMRMFINHLGNMAHEIVHQFAPIGAKLQRLAEEADKPRRGELGDVPERSAAQEGIRLNPRS